MVASLADSEIWQRARASRDARFDGIFVVGVVTTGVFCRPTCPARLAAPDNHRFFATPVAARAAGFRACLRCQPDAAVAMRGVADALVQRLLTEIGNGGLDGSTLSAMAAREGMSARQLTRRFRTVTGKTPGAIARERRLATARDLLADAALTVTEVAVAAGFGSVRRFNAAWRAAYGSVPSVLRSQWQVAPAAVAAAPAANSPLFLRWVGNYAADAMLRYLGKRSLPGIETVAERTYRRMLGGGSVSVRFCGVDASTLVSARRRDRTATVADGVLDLHPDHLQEGGGVSVQFTDVDAPAMAPALARVHRLFDLGANAPVIESHLASDALLAASLARTPGLRVAGCFDAFELAVRAVLGQQVSVGAATTLAARLLDRFGERQPGGGMVFPEPSVLARADVAAIGMPRQRGMAVSELARRVEAGHLDLECADSSAVARALTAIPGIGPWTAQYVAMRVCRDPDAFPALDVVLRKAAGGLSVRDLLARAEAWRPWRAYAAMYLWQSVSSPAGLAGAQAYG